MKTDKELSQLVYKANEDELRDMVLEWAESHSDFRTFVGQRLCPSIEDVDFTSKLRQAVDRETKGFFSRHDVRVATDWSNVYQDLIKPWSENTDSLSTERLYDLIYVIVCEIGMQVADEDFYGDDWYGDDFSGDIRDIMDVLANLAGLLMVREDLSPDIVESLTRIVKEAQKEDVIDSYMGSPYAFILDLIKDRLDAEEVSCGLFDNMIEANFGNEAGKWICRKIEFIRSMGLPDEAQSYMESEIEYPEVCLKYYNELIASGQWGKAVKLLDKAQTIKEDSHNYFSYRAPNWLELKQQILMEHGTKEECVDNLKRLFHTSLDDKARYYHQLKDMIDVADWKAFYHNLLSDISGYNAVNYVAPFLIEEGEFDWLFRLVSESEQKDAADYRTPLRYAGALYPTHFDKMQAILVRTIRAYAADRFPRKKKVNTSKYSYFRANLETLAEIGYAGVQKEIVEYLLEEYRFRPSLAKELRSIKLME